MPKYSYTDSGLFFVPSLPVTGMCEEVRNPSREVPQALAWSIPIGFLTSLVFLLPVTFTLPDIGMLLAGEASCYWHTNLKLMGGISSTWRSTYWCSVHDYHGVAWWWIWHGTYCFSP